MLMLRLLPLLLALVVGGTADATVLAAGQPLTRDFVEQLLSRQLPAQLPGSELQIVIDSPSLPLGNQSAAATEIDVQALSYDPAAARFSGLLVGMADGDQRFQLPIHGRVQTLVELPVLRRAMAVGERVAAADLDWVKLDAKRIASTALTDPAQLIGFEARRPLPAGRVLTSRDLGPSMLVHRGRPVRLIYQNDGLVLTAIGMASDDGALGEPVRILNTMSRQEVQGIVSGPDEVALGDLSEPTLASN